MGGGSWSTNTYRSTLASNAAAGYTSAFTHTEDVKKGKAKAGVHESLDPKLTNKAGARAERNIREALDSDEHPNATAIAVLFDVTGSMGTAPRVLQEKLTQLHGVLQRKGYVEDPQILFGGIGDAYSDRGPLQIGQFESDNAMDENLGNVWLEGGGGGGCHESYELALYFMARHTYLDSLKRADPSKGYLFIIGDERVYKTVSADQVRKVIGGDSAAVNENISTEAILREAQEKYNVFFVFAKDGSYDEANSLDDEWGGRGYGRPGGDALGWRPLLGENCLVLESMADVCELIALTLGVHEGTVTLEDGMDDLKDAGASDASVRAAGKALATVGAGTAVAAKSVGELDLADEGGPAERL